MLWLGVFGHVFARDRSDTTRAVDFCSAECARNSSRKEGSGLSAALCYLASAIFSMLSWPRTICSFYKSRVPLLHYLLIRTLSNSTALHWPRFIAYHAVRVYCSYQYCIALCLRMARCCQRRVCCRHLSCGAICHILYIRSILQCNIAKGYR